MAVKPLETLWDGEVLQSDTGQDMLRKIFCVEWKRGVMEEQERASAFFMSEAEGEPFPNRVWEKGPC